MIQRLPIRATIACGLAAILAACGGAADDAGTDDTAASSGEPDIIEVRQANFEGIGDAFKAIRGQLEGDTPDYAVIVSSAETINGKAQLITGHFPEGTGIGSGADTEALEAIWEKPEEFADAASGLVDASAALATTASTEDLAAVQAAVGDLGGACKTCHDNFRLKTD